MDNLPKWRQYRKIESDEFIVVFGDCSQGGDDSNYCQFMSVTKMDFPLVYSQNKSVAMNMTQDIFPVLEQIFDITGIPPVVCFERQMGGASEMQRLYDLNVKNKYRIYVMPIWGKDSDGREMLSDNLGWETNMSTRPKMLGEWRNAMDKNLFRIYDRDTISQHKTFVVIKGKPQAARHRHDDAVMSSAGAYQLFLTCTPEKTTSTHKQPQPEWVNNLPTWVNSWTRK